MSNTHVLYAVADGEILPLSAVPDEAFASGLLGEGYAIDPQSEQFCSPVDGKLVQVTEGGHAYTISAADGLDILVHIGVDTVELGGKPFVPLVKAGDSLHIGTPLVHVDVTSIRKAGYSPITPVLICNVDGATNITRKNGRAEAGKTPVLSYTPSEKEDVAHASH